MTLTHDIESNKALIYTYSVLIEGELDNRHNLLYNQVLR